MGQSECVSPAEPAGSDVLLYKSIVGIFGVIALGSVVLVVILVRSRHTFTVRPFHSGICIYIASFAPYALVKAASVYRLLHADTQEKELTANLMLSGTFMIFFCLGFGGKMALIQLWMHLISRHTAGGSQQLLVASARQTWKFMRLTVLLVCVLYSAGFIALVGVFARASVACAAAADSTSCIALSLNGTMPEDCQRQVDLTRGITYYEGVFAAVVAVVFTLYALLFNGLAYALLTSDATFSNLTRLQRMLISNKLLRCMMSPCERARCQCVRRAMSVTPRGRFIPPSWRPAPYQTTGELELWRSSLRALGTELAVISVCSFACKAVLVALKYFELLREGSSLYLSLSTLLVEALPTLLTIALLMRYHARSAGAARDTNALTLSDIGTSLLQTGTQSRVS
jgi:multisubunit Na+/H+ antiporter MnhG subunit